MTTIESRLAAVERQLRFHRGVIVGLLIALVALVGIGAADEIPEVIRAHRLEIISPNGKPGLVLRSDMVKDNDGKIRYVSSDIHITQYRADGSVAFESYLNGGVLQVGAIFGDTVSVSNELSVRGLLEVRNKNGKDIFSAGAGSDGDGLLNLNNSAGETRVQLDAKGLIGTGGSIYFLNKTGEKIAEIYPDEYGNGVIGAFNRQGKGPVVTPR